MPREHEPRIAEIAIPTEVELKLALDAAAVPALLRHGALRPLRRGRTRTARVVSTYFDSPDFRLHRAEVALRVRRIGRRWIQTVKGPPQAGAGAGLHARPEYEWPLPGPNVELRHLAVTPWKKLTAKAAKDGGLVPCFTTDFKRRMIPLEFPDGSTAEFCVDLGEIRATCDGRARREPVAEIEIELRSGDAANLFRLALALSADLPIAAMTLTKAARGYALRRGLPRAVPSPVRAQDVPLATDVTTADALTAIARGCLHQIAANAAGLVDDDDPEWIHQMRVGTRRLRSCLALLAPFAPAAELDRVVAEVKWLAATLGTARDWDVFVTETLPPLAAWFARDAGATPGLRRLRARAAARRRAARSAARAAVASPRFQRLLLTADLLCASSSCVAPFHARDGDDGAAGAPDERAATFAASLLARRHRKFARIAAHLAHASNEERHAARIAAKRLRYVAEFFAPLFPGKRGRTYLKRLAIMQDALGRINDAVTAASLAAKLAGPTDDAAGAVRGWVAAQATAVEPMLTRAWRRFDRARPFWPSS
ncbi:MAG: CHAD domain-containing protein [Betaproteobacteria bacterium]|nr:CHAD domain-containing protein [Betaproteobacteria bacterium]